MVIGRTFIKLNIFIWIACLLTVEGKFGISEDKVNRKPAMAKPSEKLDAKAYKSVFEQIEAQSIGENSHALLEQSSLKQLERTAGLVVSKTAFRENKNPLYVDNPDLHRLLCSFVTSYVYSAEKQNLPKESQIYLVSNKEESRDESLVIEIKRVQNIFNKCEKLELQIHPTGLIYFKWDVKKYLTGIPVDVHESTSLDIPEEFRDDPLLSKLYQTGASAERTLATREDIKIKNEMSTLFLQGLHRQLASGNPDPLKLVTKFVSKAGSKLGQKAFKERQALITSLTKNDKNLFSASEIQKRTALQLTNLVAAPSNKTISNSKFTSALKDILESDIKFKYKVGKDIIYAGFTLKFK